MIQLSYICNHTHTHTVAVVALVHITTTPDLDGDSKKIYKSTLHYSVYGAVNELTYGQFASCNYMNKYFQEVCAVRFTEELNYITKKMVTLPTTVAVIDN